MHDNTFSQENRDKFIYLAGQYNQQVKFYNVEKLVPDDVAKLKKSFTKRGLERFTIAAGLRLLLTKLFPEDIKKIIYLDADIVFKLDIKKLWQIDIEDKPFAAVKEREATARRVVTLVKGGLMKAEDYCNTGVMLINLEKLRKEEQKIWDKIKFAEENQNYFPYFEQDILNLCFHGDYLRLPIKFNYFVRRIRALGIKEIGENIYHFLGGAGGFGMDINDVYNRLFFEYFTKTPWCTPEAFGNLSKEIEKFFDERQNLSIRLTASLSGKKRAFFTDAKTFETVKTSLLCQPDEKIILTMAKDPAEELAELITESAGKELFLVFIDNYRACKDALIKTGFSEWRDFIDGKIFFSSAQGVKLNTFRFVEQM